MADSEEEVLVPLTPEQRITRAIVKLPTLTAEQVTPDDCCPICLIPFSTILDGPLQSAGVLQHLPVAPDSVDLSGVTRLDGCGHTFCRLDLIQWICGWHGNCPTCRHTFLDIRVPTDSDGESSDGDYIPDEEDEGEEDDEGFMDTEDDWDIEPASEWDIYGEDTMSDADRAEVAMDLWHDHGYLDNLGLSDEYESESLSESDVALRYSGESYVIDTARVVEGDEDEASVQGSSTGESSSSAKHPRIN